MRQMVVDAKRAPAIDFGKTTGPTPAVNASAPDLPDQLTKLAELHESGALNAEEFRQAKHALINKLG
jgi:hypothetical protein